MADKAQMARFPREVFVCLNERSCRYRGSAEIFRILKESAIKAGLRDIHVGRSGCMGNCTFGPSVLVYPGPVLYSVPTIEDAKEILERHVIGGEIVDRLLVEHWQ
jgi:(2Fe-2S) ferredoxin